MSRLRESVVKKIYEVLDSSRLGRANFEVTFPKSGQKLVKIRMVQFPSYRFEIGESGGSPVRLFTHECPGSVLKEEINGGLPLKEVLARLSVWADRLIEEIAIGDNGDTNFEKLVARLEAEIEKNVEDPGSQFTSNEIVELRERLDRLSERFELLQKKNEITEAELKELKKHLDQSSKDLQVLPKGVWYRASMSRIVSTMKKIVMSKEGREILSSAVKKLIGLE